MFRSKKLIDLSGCCNSKVPLTKQNYNKELNIIKQIANENGYDTSLVNKLLNRKKKKLLIKDLYAPSNNNNIKQNLKYFSLPYLGAPSEKVANFLKNKIPNISISYKTLSSSRSLINNKDQIGIWNKFGIYQLNCDTCNSIYVGRTSRSFDIRIKEHEKNIEHFHPEKSHFAEHILTTNHKFDRNNNFVALQICHNLKYLKSLESLEIFKAQNKQNINLLNQQLFFPTSNLFQILV